MQNYKCKSWQLGLDHLRSLAREIVGRTLDQLGNRELVENAPKRLTVCSLVLCGMCFWGEALITPGSIAAFAEMTPQTLTGHSGGIFSLAFSPDGRTLASAGVDRTIKIWTPSSGTCLKTLSGHSSIINTVVFSPDGRTLASASQDHNIRVWDPSSGSCLKTLSGHSKSVEWLIFSSDGGTLASASRSD